MSRERVRAEAVRDAADPAAVAEAERCVRAYVGGDESIIVGLWSLTVLLTEYDRRGAALASGDAALPAGDDVAAVRTILFERASYELEPDERESIAREIVAALAARSPRPETAQPGADDLSLSDAAMKAAVRARDEWRAAVEGPMAGHPDDPECIAIAEAVLAAVRDHGAAARSPREESEEPGPEDGSAFFLAAMTEHGRCTCKSWQDCHPDTAECALCRVLPGDWDCPTPAHEGYPAPAETTEETTRD